MTAHFKNHSNHQVEGMSHLPQFIGLFLQRKLKSESVIENQQDD